MPVNLRKQAGEVPGGKIFARGLGGLRALTEAPPIILKIMPIPVCQNGLQHGNHFLRSFGNLRLQTRDLLFRLVALDVAFQSDFPGNGLDCFVVLLLRQRFADDWFQLLDGSLGKSLLRGLLHTFPLRLVSGTGHIENGGSQNQTCNKSSHFQSN